MPNNEVLSGARDPHSEPFTRLLSVPATGPGMDRERISGWFVNEAYDRFLIRRKEADRLSGW
jgi:hypothetical protein